MNNDYLLHRAKHLLSFAQTVREYEEELAFASGEHFNVFDILRLGHYEVRTHSPLLRELLDPKGSHGLGATFLQLFLDNKAVAVKGFDAPSAKVFTEYSIGDLGRIDILIQDQHQNRIIIENKIYADEQPEQLLRYHKQFREATLCFLTLNGVNPKEWETNPAYNEEFKSIYKQISYEEHIIEWLQSCRKEAACSPSVRESISQYIHLLQRLTNQNLNARMSHKIIFEITKDENTYLAYAMLRNEQSHVVKAVIEKANTWLKTFAEERQFKTQEAFNGGGKTDNFFFTTAELESWNIRFGLRCYPNYTRFHYGFAYIDMNSDKSHAARIRELFEVQFGKAQHNDFWCAYAYWNSFPNWDDSVMAEIISGGFQPKLEQEMGKLADVADEVCKYS